MVVIGLTGENCSGKGTFAEYLVTTGFRYASLSDVLREELSAEGREVTREALIEKGNELRREAGPGVLAKRTMLKMKGATNCVIDSVRNPSEVEELRKEKGFTLVYVTAKPVTRFERMRKRDREGDPKTLEAFMEMDKREMSSSDPTHQQLLATFEMADKRMENDSDLQHYHDGIDALVGALEGERSLRPSWDEYFLEIAKMVGARGTCDRGRNGAVLTRDRRIISTGYVGSPRGLPHCDEAGHLMSDVLNPDGTVSKHCVRTTHAEQNAIVQAALHGVSTEGSTLYVRFEPCFTCAKMLINAGVRRVVCQRKYHAGEMSREFFRDAGVELVYVEDKVEEYPDQ